MKRFFLIALLLLAASPALPQQDSHIAKTLLVFPFQNLSSAPGLEWIGESFPEVLNQGMASPSLYAVPRDDRNFALDRLGIPTGVQLSRSSMYSVGREMDADYLVFGTYNFDGQSFTASAQIFDVNRLHLSPLQTESGKLPDLLQIESALSWDLMRVLDPSYATPKAQFVAASPQYRLDAFEAYLRGVIATDPQDAEESLKRAVQIAPTYTQAIFQLGKTYYNQHDYSDAGSWLKRVPRDSSLGLEAGYYLGLAEYYLGQFTAAQNDFDFVATRLPLTEVFNNLGVVASRRATNTAEQYFRRAAQEDPENADYHFNFGISLCRAGDRPACVSELKQALALRSGDEEIRDFLQKAQSSAPLAPGDFPLERIKVNYDASSFHQLSQAIDNLEEQRLATAGPAAHASFHFKRGCDLLAQGFVIESARELREAVRLDPTNAQAHLFLAQALEGSDQDSQARAELEASLRLQPSAGAHVALGELDLKQNLAAQARDEATQALALDPKNSSALALQKNAAARLAPEPQTP